MKIGKGKQAEARLRLEEELTKVSKWMSAVMVRGPAVLEFADLSQVNDLEQSKLEGALNIRMQHRALLENQIKDKAFKRAAAEFNKTQERMSAERSEAAYQMMLKDQMAKTSSTLYRFRS